MAHGDTLSLVTVQSEHAEYRYAFMHYLQRGELGIAVFITYLAGHLSFVKYIKDCMRARTKFMLYCVTTKNQHHHGDFDMIKMYCKCVT